MLKVAAEMGNTCGGSKEAYQSQWQFIRNTVEALPLKERT